MRDTATQASDVGRQALAEMHRMLGVLRTAEPAGSRAPTGHGPLADLVSMVRSAGPGVELTTSGTPTGTAPTIQLAIYRIVQESLTNILKHARNVTSASVTISYRQDRIRISVINDGEACADTPGGSGHGLAGMRERVRPLRRRIPHGPRRDGGWEVHAELATSAHPAVLA